MMHTATVKCSCVFWDTAKSEPGAGLQQGLGGVADEGLDGVLFIIGFVVCTFAAATVVWDHGAVSAGNLHHLAVCMLAERQSKARAAR
jgi:hypothetical protein